MGKDELESTLASDDAVMDDDLAPVKITFHGKHEQFSGGITNRSAETTSLVVMQFCRCSRN